MKEFIVRMDKQTAREQPTKKNDTSLLHLIYPHGLVIHRLSSRFIIFVTLRLTSQLVA